MPDMHLDYGYTGTAQRVQGASESWKTAHDVLDVQQDIYATIAQKLWHNARTLNQWLPQISGTVCGLNSCAE